MKKLLAWIGGASIALLLVGALGIADVRLCVGAVRTCNGPAHTSKAGLES